MEMVTANDDQRKKPNVIIDRMSSGPWVNRIPANAGIAANVVRTTTGFLPKRSESAPPTSWPATPARSMTLTSIVASRIG